ncbi:arsenate reductase (glutaredoxin) [Roseivivax lentus]|uniref:arsenate reductase (glutaredoxin) n=1 Tax=Roseivivax lentus TaxID=633194 RepID=UPI0011799706|nr:arsenate reductase (glutaredoxin) [Roseivivax lentus]
MILWHNPRCSKSRQALQLLEARGVPVTVRRYLEEAQDAAELADLHAKLGVPAIEMVRVKEPEFKAAGLSRDSDAQRLLAAMAETPKLIERPVLIAGDRAVIGRPPERILELL